MDTVIASFISMVSAIIVCSFNNKTLINSTRIEQEKTIALIKQELGELRKTVEKHNNLVERVYKIESQLSQLIK